MARSSVLVTAVLATTTVIATAAAGWLYFANRDLHDELAARPASHLEQGSGMGSTVASRTDSWADPVRAAGRLSTGTGPAPHLPEEAKESRLERRQRRQQEIAAMLGRLEGESEADYKSRVMPMITAGLLIPRQRVDEMRRKVEEQAAVTPDQSKKLDAAFDKTYADALDYTNKAIADGLLSPYERNVSGWLEYAGGLGGILGDANTQIGTILSPQQVKTINASGFEWGEYLGASAPWEKLNAPPAPR